MLERFNRNVLWNGISVAVSEDSPNRLAEPMMGLSLELAGDPKDLLDILPSCCQTQAGYHSNCQSRLRYKAIGS